jgi:hypothetical protein
VPSAVVQALGVWPPPGATSSRGLSRSSAGQVEGGGDGRDLNVMLAQFNLDGTPAAKPVEQPPVSLLAG